MGKYTLRGSKQLDQKIDADLKTVVSTILAMPDSKQWVGIILLGGYGRGEGTPCITNGKQVPYNDYDLIVVAKDLNFLKRKSLQQNLNQVAQQLTNLLGIEVDLYLHTLSTLKNAEFTLLNFELEQGYKVLWGDKELLNIMPKFEATQLPLVEGTRLLLNRGTLLLYNHEMLSKGILEANREKFLRYIFKNYLAFGDCLLMTENRYEISYKKKKIILIDKSFPDLQHSDWYIKKYREAIEFKEWADYSLYRDVDLREVFKELQDRFITFFFWYEEQRLRSTINSSIDYVNLLENEKNALKVKLKAFILNIQYFGRNAITPNFTWLFIYPRKRLYVCLPILLNNQVNEKDIELLKKLIGGNTKNEALQRFFALREKLS